MACTTILVGRKASYDGSTLIARNDDSPSGIFMPKKMIVVTPDKQPKHYHSRLSHLELDLPETPCNTPARRTSQKTRAFGRQAGSIP